MKITQSTIILLALTLVTLLAWVIFQAYSFQKREVVFNPVDSKYTQELKPNLDPKILNQLEERNK